MSKQDEDVTIAKSLAVPQKGMWKEVLPHYNSYPLPGYGAKKLYYCQVGKVVFLKVAGATYSIEVEAL